MDNTTEEQAEKKQNSNELTCYSVKLNQVISMCVVPVQVRYKGSNTVVRTMAMLDNCSQGSFVKTTLLDELSVKGTMTSVTIKTLNGDQKYQSFAVDGLEVSNVQGMRPDWIKLPRVFSQEDLPVASDEIATPENIQDWEYLHRIIPEINIDKNLDVKLLIGANCLRALEPQEVISSQGDGPYAFKTRLGWCVVGPISNACYQNKFHCNGVGS